MGLQLIFVMESNSKVKSDWIYIKETIVHFYNYDNVNFKLTPIYMDGKGKYTQKESQINKAIKQYSHSKSIVFYCFDCDDYDVKTEDKNFIDKASVYCSKKGYEMIWFCKDIERVYLGEKVEKSQKEKKSAMFKNRKYIENVKDSVLSANSFKDNTSNILCVLDKYLKRKTDFKC